MGSKIPAGKPRELPSEGSHNAVCVSVLDLGTQPARTEGWDDSRKVAVELEITDETQSDGKPFLLSKEYTFSASPKSKLSQDLKVWLGVKDPSDFDMETLLGKGATISVVHVESKSNGNTYANIAGIMGIKGKAPKAVSPLKSLFLNEESWDQDTFASLPEFWKNKIVASPEYSNVVDVGPAKTASKTPPTKTAAKKTAKKK